MEKQPDKPVVRPENPVARALQEGQNQIKIVKARKGRGSYTRKGRNGEISDTDD